MSMSRTTTVHRISVRSTFPRSSPTSPNRSRPGTCSVNVPPSITGGSNGAAPPSGMKSSSSGCSVDVASKRMIRLRSR